MDVKISHLTNNTFYQTLKFKYLIHPYCIGSHVAGITLPTCRYQI